MNVVVFIDGIVTCSLTSGTALSWPRTCSVILTYPNCWFFGNFPSRSFVCIGDSTQRDPEAYAQMAREFPHWVRAIFIRRVTGPGNDESKTGPDRFEKAFKGLDRGLWHVFDDPTELYARVDALVAGDPLGTGSGTGDAPPTEPESSQKRGCVVL